MPSRESQAESQGRITLGTHLDRSLVVEELFKHYGAASAGCIAERRALVGG